MGRGDLVKKPGKENLSRRGVEEKKKNSERSRYVVQGEKAVRAERQQKH